MPFWKPKARKSELVEDIDDFKGAPEADPANPERVSRRLNDINGVVSLALLGALIYSLVWNLHQHDRVVLKVQFVGFAEENGKMTYHIMEDRQSAVERSQGFAKQNGEDYILYYNELVRNQADMTRRWNVGGWVWAHSDKPVFLPFQEAAGKAWKTLESTKVEQHVKDIKCANVGSDSLSCTYTAVQVDEHGVERGSHKWMVSQSYAWLTEMPAEQYDKNPVGWIVTSYEANPVY